MRKQWAGMVQALAPIQHSDGTLGTTSVLRREKIIAADGKPTDIPVVSGNSVRGKLRRLSADLLWEQHPDPTRRLVLHQALESGGTLSKSQKKINALQIEKIRSVCPHLSLFGFSGGGQIVEGLTEVGRLLPIIAETAHITGVESELTRHDICVMQEFSRRDAAPTEGGRYDTSVEDLDAALAESWGQMRFEVQLIAAGTKFTWRWALGLDATDAEEAWWLNVIARLNSVGGRSSAGLGLIDVQAEDPPPLPETNWDAILEATACLT